jgi:hypothetical protein
LLHHHYGLLTFTDAAPAGLPCDGMGLMPGQTRSWIALRLNSNHHFLAGLQKARAAAARMVGLFLSGDVLRLWPFVAPRVELLMGIDRFHAARREAGAVKTLMPMPGDHTFHSLDA